MNNIIIFSCISMILFPFAIILQEMFSKHIICILKRQHKHYSKIKEDQISLIIYLWSYSSYDYFWSKLKCIMDYFIFFSYVPEIFPDKTKPDEYGCEHSYQTLSIVKSRWYVLWKKSFVILIISVLRGL